MLLCAAPGSAGRVHQVRSTSQFVASTVTDIANSGIYPDMATKTEFFRGMVNQMGQSMGINTSWHTRSGMLEHAVKAQELRHPAYDQSKDMSEACKGVYAFRYPLEQLLDSEECNTVWKHWPECIARTRQRVDKRCYYFCTSSILASRMLVPALLSRVTHSLELVPWSSSLRESCISKNTSLCLQRTS